MVDVLRLNFQIIPDSNYYEKKTFISRIPLETDDIILQIGKKFESVNKHFLIQQDENDD